MTEEEWNETYPVGTEVTYWLGDKVGPGVRARTRSRACVFHDGLVVVYVDGLDGPVHIAYVEPVARMHAKDEHGECPTWCPACGPQCRRCGGNSYECCCFDLNGEPKERAR